MAISRRASQPRPANQCLSNLSILKLLKILPFPRQHIQNPGLLAGWTANQTGLSQCKRAFPKPYMFLRPIPSQSSNPTPPKSVPTLYHPSVGPSQMPPTPPMSAQLSPSTAPSAMNIPVQVNSYPQISSNHQPPPMPAISFTAITSSTGTVTKQHPRCKFRYYQNDLHLRRRFRVELFHLLLLFLTSQCHQKLSLRRNPSLMLQGT